VGWADTRQWIYAWWEAHEWADVELGLVHKMQDGVKLSIDNEVLDFMVKKANEFQLGARGLRSICEAILTDAMFDIPSSTVKILDVNIHYAEEKFSKSKIATLKVA
jgi:ATP-dependent Clp protease ATP-binding subunit ClpX